MHLPSSTRAYSLYGFYSVSRTFEVRVILRWNDQPKNTKACQEGHTQHWRPWNLYTMIQEHVWSILRKCLGLLWANLQATPALAVRGTTSKCYLWQCYSIFFSFEDLNLFKCNQDSKTHQNSKAMSGLWYFMSLCWGFWNSKTFDVWFGYLQVDLVFRFKEQAWEMPQVDSRESSTWMSSSILKPKRSKKPNVIEALTCTYVLCATEMGILVLHYSCVCDSRSKVLYSNFKLGGTQPTLYMILHFRCVASRKEIPQNTSKAQGSRKVGASVSMHYHNIYIYIFICWYIYIYLLHCSFGILSGSRSSGFRIWKSNRSKTEKLSCISRASCAQAPRKQKNAFGWSKEGGPRKDDHFLGKKAREIPEEFVHTTEEKRETTHCSEGKAKESKEWCHVP